MVRFSLSSAGWLCAIGLLATAISIVALPEGAVAQTAATSQSSVGQLLLLGKQQYRRAEFRAAIATYQHALKLAQQGADRAGQAKAMAELGSIYSAIDQKQGAEDILLAALKLAREAGDRRVESDILGSLVGFYLGKQDLKKAQDLAQELQSIAAAADYQKGMIDAKVSQRTGRWIEFVQQQQFKQALEESQAILQLAQDLGEKDGIVYAYDLQSATYRLLQNTSEAEKWFQQSQALSKSIGYPLGAFNSFKLAGDLIDLQKQPEQKLSYYQQSLAIAHAADNPWFQQGALVNLGFVYVNQNKLTQALEYLQKALGVARTIDDDAVGAVENSIGVAYFRAKQYPQALENFQKAIASYQKTSNQAQLVQVWSNVGEAYEKQKQFAQAREAYQQALTIAHSTNNNLSLQYWTLINTGQTYSAEATDVENNKHDHLQAVKLYRQGLELRQQALAIARQIPNRNWEMETLRGIAISYNGQEMASALAGQDPAIRLILSDKALQFAQQALVIAKDFKSDEDAKRISSFMRLIYGEKVDSYLELKQYDNALAQVQLMYSTAKESGDPKDQELALNREAFIYADLVFLYNNPEQYDKLVEASQRVIALRKQLNSPESGLLQYEHHIAYVYDFRGQYDKALSAYERISIRAQAIHDVQAEFYALSNIGSIHKAQADYSQAASFYEKAWQLGRIQRDNRTNESTTLNNIALLDEAQGRYGQALTTAQQSLSISQKEYEQHVKGMTLENIRELCLTYDKRSNFNAEVCDHPDKPRPGLVFNQIKDLIDSFANSARYRMGTTLGNIGRIYADQGDYHKSIEYSQKALEIARELKKQGQEAVSYNNLGKDYTDLGQYDKARDFLLKGLKIASAQHNLGLKVAIHTNLGTIASAQGDYPTALNDYQQALTLSQKAKMQSREAITLSRIGGVYQSQGNYALAFDNYQKALAIQERIHEPANIIDTKLQLGNLQRQLGQRPAALATHQAALTLAQKIGAAQLEAKATLALATDLRDQGQFDPARQRYQQALQIAQSITDLNGENQSLAGLGGLYAQQNQPDKALPYLTQALALQQRMGIKPRQAETLNAIGQTQTQLEKYAEAQATLQQAYFLAQTLGDRATEAQALAHLGQLFVHQNQPQLAIVFYKQSVNTYETIRTSLRSLPPDQQKSYTATISTTYRALADLLISQTRISEAQQVLERLKIKELNDFSQGTRAPAAIAEIGLSPTETQITTQYHSLIAFGQKIDDCDQTNCAQHHDLETQYQNLNKEFGAFLEQIKQQLHDGRLVEVAQSTNDFQTSADRVVNPKANPDSILIYPLVLPDKTRILWAAKGGVLSKAATCPLGETVLNAKIAKFRSLISHQGNLLELKAVGKELYDCLIKPLEGELSANGIKHLIFVPDRATNYIPMAALYDGKQYLIEKYAISNILSASLTDTTDKLQSPTQTPILALGFSQGNTKFSALPSVEAELSAIVKQPSSQGIYPGDTFLNNTFTKSALEDNLRSHRIIHIATHGEFKPTNPRDSYFVLGTGSPYPIADVQALRDLKNVHLVVLSACETALGGKDDLVGLQVAGISSFFMGNKDRAKAVMASLWQVNDNSTALLMQQFYQTLATGTRKAAALQQVQIRMIQRNLTAKEAQALPRAGARRHIEGQPPVDSFEHPYFWAPFILIGNSL
jgi:CHAT domain-containing protein/Tfp pilus assembly protein PilF